MIKKCKVCSSKILALAFESKHYQVVQCQKCKFGMLESSGPVPNPKDIYNASYFVGKDSSDFSADAQKKFDFVKNFLPGKASLLDFGCGLGDFLGIAKSWGFRVQGYDISKFAAKEASRRYGIKVKSSPFKPELFKEDSFDTIVSFDVVEHIPYFRPVFRALHRWLKKPGLLFITTPNIESWDARLLGGFWYGYNKFPEHVNFFSPQSIKIALTKSGFEVKQIRTWGFVRSLDFVFEKIFGKSLGCKKQIFFPLVDMMVVAKKL